MSDDWRERLLGRLEPVLALPDPRPKLSAYHDMPYAIFRYSPDDEFALRKELDLLTTRLTDKNKAVTSISLARCLEKALTEHAPVERLADAERTVGVRVSHPDGA